ncbi:hypothetical protein JCM11957_02470 [Caminibacter profundus]
MIKYNDKKLILPLEYSISLISTILKNFNVEIIDIEKNENYIFFLDKELNKESLKIIKNILLNKLPIECKLYLLANFNLTLKDINLTRAIAKYQKQLLFEFEETLIIKTLITYPSLTTLIIEYFKDKLLKKDLSKEKLIEEKLKDITNSNHHKIFEFFYVIVKNIVRTNYFLYKETISFKIYTQNFKNMLFGIQPNIEMFVYHKDFSGIHLRISKISRGGIRYSSREDFREEVRDLVKTQMIKNAFIIPDGAKGGFFIYNKKVDLKKIYSLFIDALLDLIDLPNLNIIKYDKEDFYFVVAADKGTSYMSDIANEIAIKRNYFLKDAFASGGSTGYNHKELGITAKGAIKSASRYFIEIGKNIYKDKISVVGIGSMRGDVFGNGMLLNKNFLLIAAISHSEIFIDPNPNPEIAFKERKRLFENELSWSNYDKSKISKGGGVFKRDNKKIKLSPEIKKLLNSKAEYLSGEELVKEILKLKVDMLYFGGIGTYVKASDELNIHISDKQNENIRVNANELNAFCIVEGANLALTQKARYEYALNGGKINMDAIDNSAGVNISDYEVNLKIILNELINKKVITEDKKVSILKELTDEVIEKVLNNNENHSLIITLDTKTIYKEKLIKILEILENHTEFKREYYDIAKNSEIESIYYKNELIRPITSLLLLYSKIFLKRYILKNLDLDQFEEFFINYFPKSFQYKSSHPLKKEIIATEITNEILNKFGIDFLSDFNKNSFKSKIFSYLVLIKLYEVDKLFKEAKNINDTHKQYEILIDIQKTVKFANKWLSDTQNTNFNPFILLTFKDELFEINLSTFQKQKTLIKFLPVILYFRYEGNDLNVIIKLFEAIISKFKINKLLKEINEFSPKTKIQKNLKEESEEMIEHFVISLAKEIIISKSFDKNNIKKSVNDFLKTKEKFKDIINEIKKSKKDILDLVHISNSLILTLK